MVTAYDNRMIDYGRRMLASFRRFNPAIPMYFCDFGGLDDRQHLIDLGVEVLTSPMPVPKVRPNFWDCLLATFVDQLEWDRLLWIDADTLVLRPIAPALMHDVDFVGHGDRDNNGVMLTCGWDKETMRCTPGVGWIKFASGLWSTSSREMLDTMRTRIKKQHYSPTRDSDLITSVVNQGCYTYRQLDSFTWNFSRNLIPLAKFNGESVYYEMDGRTYHPFTAGFSRVPVNGRDVRLESDELKRWYRGKVSRKW